MWFYDTGGCGENHPVRRSMLSTPAAATGLGGHVPGFDRLAGRLQAFRGTGHASKRLGRTSEAAKCSRGAAPGSPAFLPGSARARPTEGNAGWLATPGAKGAPVRTPLPTLWSPIPGLPGGVGGGATPLALRSPHPGTLARAPMPRRAERDLGRLAQAAESRRRPRGLECGGRLSSQGSGEAIFLF